MVISSNSMVISSNSMVISSNSMVISSNSIVISSYSIVIFLSARVRPICIIVNCNCNVKKELKPLIGVKTLNIG
jgi:hypothetical protein